MRTVASLRVRDRRGRELLVSNKGEVWKFVGGEQEKDKDGEDIEKTLLRELFEELGLRLREIPKEVYVEEYPSQSAIPTRYHIFVTTEENLVGEPRINRKDKVDFFEWVEKPLERKLNPCAHAVIERHTK